MASFYLGLDLGGTNVKAGLVDDQGHLVSQVSVPTGTRDQDLAPAPVLDRMIAAGSSAIERSGVARSKVAAVGVLSPGQASLARGVVFRSANLPLWKNVPIRARVSAGLRLPAILENDANAAAYGEFWAGAGKAGKAGKSGKTRKKPLSNLFMFTLGTGVGGGIVYNGQVIRGASDFAAEVGHMIVEPGGIGPPGEPCGCGQRGCLERYCSAKYLAQRATNALEASPTLRAESSLGELLKTQGTLTAADIAAHAMKGDRFANQAWDEGCRYLAIACINVCHMMDPEMIVLAGGMSKAGHFLVRNVQKHFRSLWWKMTRPTTTIALAKLGNDAGVIGAAGVAKAAHDQRMLPPVGR